MWKWRRTEVELIAQNVCKIIRGKPILSDVNLRLEGGSVYGFAGPNGSGKTMLFRALSGLISVTSGTISLDGKVLRRDFVTRVEDGVLTVTLLAECEEQIGRTVEREGETGRYYESEE